MELHWFIQVEDLARCPGKHQILLNGDNVILFSDSMPDFVWIRPCTLSLSCLQMGLSCLRLQRTSTRDLCYLCLIFEVLMPKYPEGEVSPLRSSEIQDSNKISLCKQSGSNVLRQQPRQSRVRHLLLGSHHSKVEIIPWTMKASVPSLNMIGRLVPCQTLHGILSLVCRLRDVWIHVFFEKKKYESTCQ